MGVPKFYRWISERYPCLSEVVKEFQIPEFDNLYLDMNGIIHVCSHPEDDNPHFRISEEDIFISIFHYIEFLFRMIKPRKVFFMAVDGVAPRAKMNQQRGRRFRSAREAENLINQAKERGEILPTEKRFDSNCITPGTQFMVKLQTQLQYFVVQKISTDPLWQGVDVYLSGHETPGEGEHKIMDFIRYSRSQPNYDPNTRHCLYGLDADLIMLGLTSHEPHFSLLREEVRFGGKKDKNRRPHTPEETTFLLLHLSLLREYLGFEFADLEHRLPFPYDLERVIDDWILMSFLVGNDFIPHLPHLHINHDGLPTLWTTYMLVLPTCDGYLTDGGHLNLQRFQKYIAALSELDLHKFQETGADAKWLANKSTRGRPCRPKVDLPESPKKEEIKWRNLEKFEIDDEKLIGGESPECETPQNIKVPDNSDAEDRHFTQYKKEYYMNKLEYKEVTPEVLRHQAEIYVTALQWILLYYFEGCQSWSWYYPHHYAPFMSDIVNIKDLKLRFEMGTPFLPFQQLMAVLPSASKEFLPLPFQELMTSEHSPLKDYYPENFETDLNGKMQEWEAVVLIPFIDENFLIRSMNEVAHRMTSEEKNRNKHGPCLLYQYVTQSQGVYPSTMQKRFPDLAHHYSKCTYVPIDKFHVNPVSLEKGLLANQKKHVYYPGFPTLRHIRHRAELKRDGVKVFQSNSRGENMIIQIIDESEQDLKTIALDLLGKSIYVDWPHLYEARVLNVSDDLTKYFLSNNSEGSLKWEKTLEHNQTIWHREVNAVADKYHSRRGIDIGPTFALIHACPMTGRRYIAGSHGNITLEKQFSEMPQTFVLQACVKDIVMEESALCQYKTIDDLFALEAAVFIIGWPHYGCQGKVFHIEKAIATKVHVNISIPHEPNLEKIIHNQQSFKKRYMPAYIACQRLGINTHFLSRMTGTVFVQRGSRENPTDQKSNIGLNLKFSKRNEEVPGYTKRTEDGWMYSDKAVDAVMEYLRRFPAMWEYISHQDHTGNDIYFEADVFLNQSDTLQDVVGFLKTLPCTQIKPQKVGCEVLDEGIIQAVQNEVMRIQSLNKNVTNKDLPMVPQHLFRPFPLVSNLIPDPEAKYQLFDRVVNVRQGFTVPFGLRGTVVGVHPWEKESDVIYDVVFDEPFPNGIDFGCSARHGYRLHATAMINLSYGQRKYDTGSITPSPFPARMSYQAGRSYAKTSMAERVQQAQRYQDRQMQAQRQGSADRDDTFHLNSCHDAATPQFVTPKMFNQQQSNPKLASDKSSKMEKPNIGNSNEFADMWKQLQQHKNDAGESSTSPHPGNQKNTNWSLTKAAQALEKLPNPSSMSNLKELSKNKNFSNSRDHVGDGGGRSSSRSGVGGGSFTSDVPAGSQAGNVSNSANMTRLNLDNLFERAVKQDMKTLTNSLEGLKVADPIQKTKSPQASQIASGSAEDGTAALRHMLHIGESKCRGWYENVEVIPDTHRPQVKQQQLQQQQQQSQQQPPSQQQQQPQPLSSSNSSLSSSSSSSFTQSQSLDSKSNDLTTAFTRQVTVEELFEGAKEQAVSKANLQQPQGWSQSSAHTLQQKHPTHPAYVNVSTANHLLLQARTVGAHTNAAVAAAHQQQQLQQQQQQLQQQQLHRGPPPGLPKHQKNYNSKGRRSNVAELNKWCCQAGIGAIKYDYSGTKNHITARVMLPNGVRIQGSVCQTREEAAESAASMALLPATNMMLPYPFVPHPGLIPSAAQLGQLPQQFPSPNSAFSPVVPRGPTPGWGLVAPNQHLQKMSWYTPPANLSGTVNTVPNVTYQSSSTVSQFGNKQQLIGNTLVSTMTPTQALCNASASLNRPVANGSSNASESTIVSQSSKVTSNRGHSEENATMGKMAHNKTPVSRHLPEGNHTQPLQTIAFTPVTSNSSFTSAETHHKAETSSETSKSEQKSLLDTNLDTKTPDTSSSNKSEVSSTKTHRKKGRSRIAANFGAVPPPGTN